MGNIIKAQLYQLCHEKKVVVIAFVVIWLVLLLNVIGETGFGTESITAGEFLTVNGTFISIFASIFSILFASYVCGSDFMDKTTYYELLTGHRRKEVYWGRACVSLVLGILGSMVLLIAPIAAVTILGGWGNELVFEKVAVRILLTAFPLFRIICEIICLTYMTKNSYISMSAGVLAVMFGQNLPMFIGRADSVLLGLTNMSGLYTFDFFLTYSAVTLEEYHIYESALDASYIMETVVASLGIGVLFLVIGYWFFRTDDLG